MIGEWRGGVGRINEQELTARVLLVGDGGAAGKGGG